MNTDVVLAVSDRATDTLDVVFGTDVGRRVPRLAPRRPGATWSSSLSSLGLSGICNVLGAIKVARQLELGSDDAVVTIATDGAAMYASERERALAKHFPAGFDELAAAETFGEHVLGATTDNLLRTDARGAGADLQPRLLHVGRAAGRLARGLPGAARPGLLGRRARPGGRVGRADRRAQREGGRPGGGVSAPVSRLVCSGCGAGPSPSTPYPFRCRNAGRGDDIDHVLRRELDLSALDFPAADPEPNPFLRYRPLLHAYHLGLSDDDFCALVRLLDSRVAAVDGHGFEATPFERNDELSERLGFAASGGVWVKDETGNVSGSHKARHLFGVLLYLEAAEQVGLADAAGRPELAIASCGNAALAAAVVARAGGRPLRVFVPVDADPCRARTARGARRTRHHLRTRRTRPATRPTADSWKRWTRARSLSPARATSTASRSRAGRRWATSWPRAAFRSTGWSSRSAAGRWPAPASTRFARRPPSGRSRGCPASTPSRPRGPGRSSAPSTPSRPAATSATRRRTAPSSCGPGSGSRTASPTASSTTRPTTGWPWSRGCSRPAAGRSWSAEETLVRANELAVEATGIDVDATGSAGLGGLLSLREAGARRGRGAGRSAVHRSPPLGGPTTTEEAR